jgi:serine/threonine protein kinase
VGVAEPLTIIRDRYRLDERIGEGGMATVWRAWDLTLERPVAVKLLFARDTRNEEVLVARFLREARIAASVQHRNVIHIVDFGTTPEGQPFMVMELLEGETLAARLRREKPLPASEVVQIGNLTLRGLASVHAAGIIHRDLKPENVYLKIEGEVVYPKILDLGISRSIEPASGPRSALTTRDGVIVGTPEYMSPEQARGVKQLDYRTDLYSMGVVLYEALTGRLPYTSENVGDLIIKIVTGSAPPVHELRPEVPIVLSRVVAKAMSRLAGDRFSDALTMQEALVHAGLTAAPGGLPLLSDLPPQRPGVSPLPYYARTTRRPATPMPRTQTLPPMAAGSLTAPAPPPGGAQPSAGFPAADGGESALDPFASPAAGMSVGDDSDSIRIWRASATSENDTVSIGRFLAGTGARRLFRSIGVPRISSSELGQRIELLTGRIIAAPPVQRFFSSAPIQRARLVWRRWNLQLMAAGALGLIGVVLISVMSSARPPVVVELSAPRRVSVPAPPRRVKLELTGLPDDATVLLEDNPAQPTMTFPADGRARSISVLAPGKLLWHLDFAPDADQRVAVDLRDEVPESAPTPAAAAKPKKTPRKKLASKSPGALRIPDF